MRWLFTDRASGRIVIAQWPNLALWTFLTSIAVEAIVAPGTAHTAVTIAGTGSLIVWAFDEILRGVNPWRRTLGGAVLLALCARAIIAFVHRA